MQTLLDFARLYYETFKKQNIPIIRIKPLVFQTFELNNHFFFFCFALHVCFPKIIYFQKFGQSNYLKAVIPHNLRQRNLGTVRKIPIQLLIISYKKEKQKYCYFSNLSL